MQSIVYLENGNPLAEGTALKFGVHEVIVGYTALSEQVFLEKSKLHKMPRITNPGEYGGVPGVISRRPKDAQHGALIVQRAVVQINEGKPWTLLDNCQDFASKAYDEQSGSETRNLVIGALSVFGLIGLAAASSR